MDHFLVQRAVEEGVEYLDHTDLTEFEQTPSGYRAIGSRKEKSVVLEADLMVDASGTSGFLARHLGVPSRLDQIRFRTGLVFGHFEGVVPFRDAAETSRALFVPGPYPDERAAIHHLLPDGWMYQLPFDHGVVSAGFVIEHNVQWPGLRHLPPDTAFARLLNRYPTIREQFADARPTQPLAIIERLQRQLSSAAGSRWVLLPHAFAFTSPLFSTGIAWSLLGVERLAWLLESVGTNPRTGDLEAQLKLYGALLVDEASHLGQLIEGAYAVRAEFDLFVAYSALYFVAASYAEASQRLLPPPAESGSWCMEGFLGTADPVIRGALARTRAMLHATPPSARTPGFAGRFLNEIRDLVRPRNVVGLADPVRNRMYPVDLDALIGSAELLGLSGGEIRDALPRVRGIA